MSSRATPDRTDFEDGDLSLSDIVRAQSEQLARQSEQIERLTELLAQTVTTLAGRAHVAAVQVIAEPPPSPSPIVAEVVDTFTFAELWERYASTLQHKPWFPKVQSMFLRVLTHFAPSTWVPADPKARRRRNLRRTAGPDMLASAIRPFHWTDFRERLKRSDPKMAVATRNLMLRRLKAMYNFAIDDGHATTNPVARVKIETPRPKRETILSDEEIDRLKTPIVRAYILTIVDSGVRPGEARWLKWSDVDLGTHQIVLSWTTTKGQKTRLVIVTPRVIEAWRALPRREGNPYVFASSRSDNPYSEARMWQLFRADVDAAGLHAAPGDNAVHAHDGRRSFASRLNEKNVAITKIQKLLGHSSAAVTETYITIRPHEIVDAHALLDASQRKPAQPAPPKTDTES